MTAAAAPDTTQLIERGLAAGISEIGVCHAEHYARTEAIIADRAARGMFADLKFTMSRPEWSCHPERLVEGACSVVSAALCYWAPDAPVTDSERPVGSIARYTRADAYDALRVRLELLAEWLRECSFEARVLVDDNHHVDREAASRSGVGFYGKHTNVITRRFGSWVVLGTIVTDAPLAATEPMRPGCGSCTACIDACPTDAISAAGELDVRSCITYWTQSRHAIPDEIRNVMHGTLYGCDICQDVCPWNRGVEKRLVDAPATFAHASIVDWLSAPGDELIARYERLFIPRKQVRFLRRNALVALARTGTADDAALAVPFLDDPSPLLREQAEWTLRQLGGPIAEAALERVRTNDSENAPN